MGAFRKRLNAVRLEKGKVIGSLSGAALTASPLTLERPWLVFDDIL